MPFHCDDPRTDKWAMQTLDEIHPIAKRSRNLLHEGDEAGTNSDQYPVEIVPTVVLKREGDQEYVNSSDGTSYSSLPEWSKDPRLQFQTLTMEMLWWQNQVLKVLIGAGLTPKQALAGLAALSEVADRCSCGPYQG